MTGVQVLSEPRAREMLPTQMNANYVRKLLDIFRVSMDWSYADNI